LEDVLKRIWLAIALPRGNRGTAPVGRPLVERKLDHVYHNDRKLSQNVLGRHYFLMTSLLCISDIAAATSDFVGKRSLVPFL
jgi:hypothetical protein